LARQHLARATFAGNIYRGELLKSLEAGSGIEPLWTDLQSAYKTLIC